ncbi:hypothetical protein SteCoe_34022 [Stentor coeruleus]|uniref:RING-type domain-containing protein n=1 Tax=Stentor coeruleus TaxID=5963 RepID=A0A1R2AVD3_9CILI|nr:hypothetical protein SteCoe_34022 [Stentor coeruleus]
MIILLLSISCAQGFLNFITPDELKNLTAYEEIATFSPVQFLPNYGKLAFADVNDCEVNGNYDKEDVITIFQNDLDDYCEILELATSAKHAGGGAFVFILSDDDYYYYDKINYEGEELVYAYEGNDKIDIFCLIVYGGIDKALKDYKNSTVWVNYGYKTIPREYSPKIKYFMASDYSIDAIFFSELNDLDYYEDLSLYNLELVFLSDYDTYDYESGYCVNTNNSLAYDISYCLYSNDYATGYQKIMSTVIILNYYYSLPPNYYLYYFLSFLYDVYDTCFYDYGEECISEIVTYYEGVPNTDPYILVLHHTEFYLTIPCYSVNGVFIYTQGYLTEAYILGYYNSYYGCDDDCMYYELTDLNCKHECNSTVCGYDNLLCLQENNCFIFTYGDGYCSQSCLSDPDCETSLDSSSDDYPYLLLKILIPIIGGLLIILIVVFVLYIIYIKKKVKVSKDKEGSADVLNEGIKAITFTKKVPYNGEALCTIDLKSISVGEKVFVIPECKHIFHYDCIKAKQEEKTYQGCPICNQVRETEANRD